MNTTSISGAPQQKVPPMPKGKSSAPQLRAMATTYPVGHLWNKFDAKVCIRGALEIEALRASHGQAPAQPISLQPAHDVVTIELLNERVKYLEAKLAGSVQEGK